MRIVHKGICTNAPLGFSVFVISDATPFVISTKCGTAARMEKSINKARFLDYGLTPSTLNDISNKKCLVISTKTHDSVRSGEIYQ